MKKSEQQYREGWNRIFDKISTIEQPKLTKDQQEYLEKIILANHVSQELLDRKIN